MLAAICNIQKEPEQTVTNEYLVTGLKSLLGHPVLIRFFRVFQQSADILIKFAIVQLMNKREKHRR